MEGSIADIIHEADMSVRKIAKPCAVTVSKEDNISTTSNVTRKKSVGRVLFIGGFSVLFSTLLHAYVNNCSKLNKNNYEELQ